MALPRGLTRYIHVARTSCVAFQATSKSAVLPICRTLTILGFKYPQEYHNQKGYCVSPLVMALPRGLEPLFPA
jgi:hypothetical protein